MAIEGKRFFRNKTATVALVVSMGVLSACDSEGQKSPTVSEASSTTAFDPSSKELSTHRVLEGSIGALKDRGLEVSTKVSDTIITETEKKDVADARRLANQIGNSIIRERANDNIDSNLAEKTRYAKFNFYRSKGSIEHNKKEATKREQSVDLIINPAIRTMAERNLDLEEAQAAVEAGTGYSPQSDVAAELLKFVEDKDIKSHAERAIGGNKKAESELDKQASKSSSAIETKGFDIWSSLFDGSNLQAEQINRHIDDFNAARHRDGK